MNKWVIALGVIVIFLLIAYFAGWLGLGETLLLDYIEAND